MRALALSLLLAAATPAAADFGVGLSEMGLAIGVFTVAMAAASVPAGLASDRYGTARVLTAFFWLLALGAVACALAESYEGFLVAHGALGLAAGVFHPAGLGLLSLSVERRDLGRALGRFGVAASLGIAGAPLLMGTALGWRFGFLGLASLGFAGAMACHLLRATGRIFDGVPALEDHPHPAGATTRRRFGLVSLLAAMGVSAFLLDGFMAMFPETVASRGLGDLRPEMLSTGILLLGALGQWFGGRMAGDGYAGSRYALILLAQPMILLWTANDLAAGGIPVGTLAGFAFLNYMTQPIENKLLAVYTTATRRATAFSLKFVVALAVSAPAAWISARIYESGGAFDHVYRALALFGVLGVVAGYLFLRGTRRARELAREQSA